MTTPEAVDKRRAMPDAETLKLLHRIRTYGHVTEFALTDREAALQIEQHIAEALTREVERRREAEDKARNLAMMLRRFIWQADKSTGDTSFKVLAGKARELVERYGLTSEILRAEADAAAVDRQGGSHDA